MTRRNTLAPVQGITSKEKLQEWFDFLEITMHTNLAGYHLLHIDEAHDFLKNSSTIIGNLNVDVEQVGHEFLKHGKSDNIIMRNCLILTFSKVISTAYEAIKDYAEITKQKQKLETQPWYNFAYHIRNYFSHKYIFDFSQCNLKTKFPAEFNGKIIESTMHNQILDISIFTWDDIILLFREMKTFANTLD